jgi:hypothetical protein
MEELLSKSRFNEAELGGGAGARLPFRNRDRVDADEWIILSGRWSAPFAKGFNDQRAMDE